MSTAIAWMPPPEKNLSAASRQYVEQFGSYLVTITYLKIAVLCLSLLSLALVTLTIKTYQAFRYVKPLVIRIDSVGRAEAVQYDAFAYQPQERETGISSAISSSGTTAGCAPPCATTLPSRSITSMGAWRTR